MLMGNELRTSGLASCGSPRGLCCRWQIAGCVAALLVMLVPMIAEADDAAVFSAARAEADKAIEEQRLFLNCSVLQPAVHDSVVKFWEQDIAKAVTILSALPATRGYVAEFKRKSSISNLLMSNEPFSKIIAICQARSDWSDVYNKLNFRILSLTLPDILKKAQQ